LKGAPGRGTLAKEKPPVFGMIERGGEVRIAMLADVNSCPARHAASATISKPNGSSLRKILVYIKGLG
jgi:hypothetical protein